MDKNALKTLSCRSQDIKSHEFDDYVCKPFILEELEDKIIEHISLRSLEGVA